MTDRKQMSAIAAMKIAYALKSTVTTSAGISMSQKRMKGPF